MSKCVDCSILNLLIYYDNPGINKPGDFELVNKDVLKDYKICKNCNQYFCKKCLLGRKTILSCEFCTSIIDDKYIGDDAVFNKCLNMLNKTKNDIRKTINREKYANIINLHISHFNKNVLDIIVLYCH